MVCRKKEPVLREKKSFKCAAVVDLAEFRIAYIELCRSTWQLEDTKLLLYKTLHSYFDKGRQSNIILEVCFLFSFVFLSAPTLSLPYPPAGTSYIT